MRNHATVVKTCLAVVAALLLTSGAAVAAVPATAMIEGTLHSTGGGAAADGPYATVFAIYKDQTGGSPVWFEGPVTVTVSAGRFSYALGTATPLKPADLASGAWLGMKLGQDPELPRRPLHSLTFALRATVAESLACSGCVAASALDASALQGYLKAGDLAKVALSGSYADLFDAPDLSAYVKAATLADVATTGSYQDLAGVPDLTAYAKTADLGKAATTNKYADFTGLPTLVEVGKSCGTGLLVVGIKADGTLDCAQVSAAATIPADGIDEISNSLIFNQFTDVFSSAAALAIPDNNPIGGFSEIVVGDVGLAQKLTVSLELTNSDLSTVQVWLYDAANQEYVIYNKGGKKGDGINTSYPDPTKTISGDLTYWAGKNPKGTWRLKVVDTAFLNNTTDGQVVKWSVNLQTLSSKKIQIKGDLIVDGTISNPGLSAQIAAASTPATYRWCMFNTHQDGQEGWLMGNDAAMFGGVNPSNWTDNNYTAGHLSADKEVLRALFTRQGYAKWNANIASEVYVMYGSTNGQIAMAMFRVKNTTASDIVWTPFWWYTSYSGWSENASVAMNGSNLWTHNSCNASTCSTSLNITIPKNRTSTVIFQSGSASAYSWSSSYQVRKVVLAFYNNSLKLPAGLEFIDDLDTAAGGWEQ
jgi:subtilisin-like proprotein convertase family protein